MTSLHGNASRIIATLWGDFAGHQWIPRTRGQWYSDLMFHLISVWTNCNETLEKQVNWYGLMLIWRHCNEKFWHMRHRRHEMDTRTKFEINPSSVFWRKFKCMEIKLVTLNGWTYGRKDKVTVLGEGIKCVMGKGQKGSNEGMRNRTDPFAPFDSFCA